MICTTMQYVVKFGGVVWKYDQAQWELRMCNFIPLPTVSSPNQAQ